jgi:hypothetical protein
VIRLPGFLLPPVEEESRGPIFPALPYREGGKGPEIGFVPPEAQSLGLKEPERLQNRKGLLKIGAGEKPLPLLQRLFS